MYQHNFLALALAALASANKLDLPGWDVLGQVSFGPDPFQPSRTTQVESKSPWISSPECRSIDNGTDAYCVYSSRDFAKGRGISILSTPGQIKYIEQLPAFSKKDAHVAGENTQPCPPFEEKELPGRGRGLIANKTLHRGDRIFAHTPVLLLDDDAFQDLDNSDVIGLENTAVKRLPPSSNSMFWELYGQPIADPASDRIDTNAFEVEIDEVTHYAVFPEIARLNHDCRPNAAYFFDEDTLTHYVHAITDINPGTEITITYIDPHMARDKRISALSRSWGFTCSCSLCTMHDHLVEASNERLEQIGEMTDHLDEEGVIGTSDLAMALIEMYKQERLHAPLSNAYKYAALAFCAEKSRWNAIKYARLAVEFGLLDNGFSHDEVVQMRNIAVEPETEECWGARQAAPLGP